MIAGPTTTTGSATAFAHYVDLVELFAKEAVWWPGYLVSAAVGDKRFGAWRCSKKEQVVVVRTEKRNMNCFETFPGHTHRTASKRD